MTKLIRNTGSAVLVAFLAVILISPAAYTAHMIT